MANKAQHKAAKEALQRAIAATGSPETPGTITSLAKLVGISRQGVSQWDVVPVHRVVDVERATGVPRAELRPDIFG